ncbi:hypothetical protein [Agaribacter marinus]|uniref:Lipoprotein n=1 Tax=Agaribacter marinus TaxID=1431249 RepID=A0AA37SXL6_9ALTE|nr:hypothetical protein [Agaribacter marinus]GLR69566.1 hypothetical protein GCM10007852_04740 [Agaribacter marinus]
MCKLFIFALLGLLFACSDSQTNRDGYDWVLTADPESDAISAAHSGDRALIGVSGLFGRVIPDVRGIPCDKPQDVRYLKIDDVIDSYAERKFNALAPIYAELYNYNLREYFDAKGQDICNS